MLLCEIIKLMYHGSPNKLPLDIALSAKRIYQGMERDHIDDLFDKYCPHHQPNRHESWYLTHDPHEDNIHFLGGSINFIYQVEPITPIFICDFTHVTNVRMFYQKKYGFKQGKIFSDINTFIPSERFVVNTINDYWNGIITPNSQIEIRTSTIKCIRLVSSK